MNLRGSETKGGRYFSEPPKPTFSSFLHAFPLRACLLAELGAGAVPAARAGISHLMDSREAWGRHPCAANDSVSVNATTDCLITSQRVGPWACHVSELLWRAAISHFAAMAQITEKWA